MIYILILSATIIGLASLPFIPVEISINSQGMIQSSLERSELLASVSGRIVDVRIKDNQKIFKGDTILLVDSSLPGHQSNILSERMELLKQLLTDAVQIVSYADHRENFSTVNQFSTEQYRASWLQFLQEFELSLLNKDQAERISGRYNTLYENGAITLAESEKFRFEFDKAVSDQTLLINRWKFQWETEAMGFQRELSELLSREAEIAEQRKLFILRAHVSGSVQNLAGLQAGSYVFANQKIAEISPDTRLIALCYVKPTDIGLIRKGQTVNFQIDAFNYNQWGLISGEVIDISDDIILTAQGNAVFKVRCMLDREYLTLRTNSIGNLRKGMSFTARFLITERSLYDLLYDKLDDWLNPNLSEATAKL
ncbi:MAG: HlyD family efflux transporter periplasmic adaptor subunit [Bacteroidetes bacterium]|nr:HlyD family efflux transporter periplasmic adaptor subunit [Bacteroidota bacterium]